MSASMALSASIRLTLANVCGQLLGLGVRFRNSSKDKSSQNSDEGNDAQELQQSESSLQNLAGRFHLKL